MLVGRFSGMLATHRDQRHAQPVIVELVMQPAHLIVGDEFEPGEVVRPPATIAHHHGHVPRLRFRLDRVRVPRHQAAALRHDSHGAFQCAVVHVARLAEFRIVRIAHRREALVKQIQICIGHRRTVQVQGHAFIVGLDFFPTQIIQLGQRVEFFGRRLRIDHGLQLVDDEPRILVVQRIHEVVLSENLHGALGRLRPLVGRQLQAIDQGAARHGSHFDVAHRRAAGNRR